jgi:site-specific DNA-methyltransferase (adenine-specific)
MEYMKGLDDNAFELAICDPPYGIGAANMNMGFSASSRMEKKDWDSTPPTADYFVEISRVSKNQIIWGGNYFDLKPTRCFLMWDKGGSFKGRSFAECEMAWTSFDDVARIFVGTSINDNRIHKTQKPIKLYEWLLANYAKEGDRILDTHLGSGSSAIAAHYGGFDFVGCELDEDYFKAASERIERETAQLDMF